MRGDPAPWRVTADAGYMELDVTATAVLHDGKPLDPAAPPTLAKDAETTFLLVADPSVPAAAIDKAMLFGSDGAATLIAVRVDSGAPVFIGMGIDGRSLLSSGDIYGARAITVDGKVDPIHICAARADVANAPRATPHALWPAIRKECASSPCTSVIAVSLAGTSTAKDLVVLSASARAAGYERLVFGADAVCPR